MFFLRVRLMKNRQKRKKMLTKKKLLSLKDRTRTRKISLILTEAAHQASLGKDVDLVYINDIVVLEDLRPIDCGLQDDLKKLSFKLEDYAQALLSKLGAEPSDWDFTDDSGELDVSKRLIQDKVLVLDRIRSPYNVGAIFRSADSFGIKKIILVEGTADPEHPRARRTSRGCTETVEWEFLSEEKTLEFLKSYDEDKIMALELGGTSINTFDFPQSGVVVLGSEEFGVSPDILKCCKSRISIPMAGTKGSLNVSVAAGILMQRWFN